MASAVPPLRHHFVLVDRGLGYVHRWRASCVCGWVSVNRRRKWRVKQLYREHYEAETHRRVVSIPRLPTAAQELPNDLR